MPNLDNRAPRHKKLPDAPRLTCSFRKVEKPCVSTTHVHAAVIIAVFIYLSVYIVVADVCLSGGGRGWLRGRRGWFGYHFSAGVHAVAQALGEMGARNVALVPRPRLLLPFFRGGFKFSKLSQIQRIFP